MRGTGGTVGREMIGSTRFEKRSSGCRCCWDKWRVSLLAVKGGGVDDSDVWATNEGGANEVDAFLELWRNGNHDCPSKNASDDDSCRLLVALHDPTVAAEPEAESE